MNPIEKLINTALVNDASGHTRHGAELIAAAKAEHAALVAVAEAAKEVNRLTYSDWFTLSKTFDDLAAVRAGSEVSK